MVNNKIRIIKWGLGIGDWGLWIGDWGVGRMTDMQSQDRESQIPHY